MLNQKVEQDLMAGDEIIQKLTQGNKNMSAGTSRQLAMGLKQLQFLYRWHSKLSPKKMIIAGVISFVVGIGLFKIGMIMDGALPINGYHADSNSYEYRRYQEVNDGVAGYMFSGFLCFMFPFAEVGVFFWTRSGSRKYVEQLKQLKTTLEKTA